MAFTGLRKQITKAEQYVNEKVGLSEATKLDEEYVELEGRTDTLTELLEELKERSKTMLQPNPGVRSKMGVVNSKGRSYPQVESQFGESLTSLGKRLTETSGGSLLGDCCLTAGETLKKVGELKYGLDESVRTGFLEPVAGILEKEVKELGALRRKVQSRRLDFDGKRRRAKGTPDAEVSEAEEKFQQSLASAHKGMLSLQDEEVNQVQLLSDLFKQLFEHHFKVSQQMQGLVSALERKKAEFNSQAHPMRTPQSLYQVPQSPQGSPGLGSRKISKISSPKSVSKYGGGLVGVPQCQISHGRSDSDFSDNSFSSGGGNGGGGGEKSDWDSPCCQSIYGFDAEKEGELGFPEGATIKLIEQLDMNWFVGEYSGQQGHFPISYVKVLVPLP